MSQIASKTVTTQVSLPLAEKLDRIAARLERPRDWIVKQALSAWIAQEDERYERTLEALADVDAGALVSHEAVINWVAELERADESVSKAR